MNYFFVKNHINKFKLIEMSQTSQMRQIDYSQITELDLSNRDATSSILT